MVFYFNGGVLKIPLKELILVAGLKPATSLKNELLHRYFSRVLTTDFRTPLFQNNSHWLLLVLI